MRPGSKPLMKAESSRACAWPTAMRLGASAWSVRPRCGRENASACWAGWALMEPARWPCIPARCGAGTSAGSSSSTCCRYSGPGDIVLWDNARIHEAPDLVEQIEARGACVRPLPRYSPEFNPIELLWSKLKHLIKKACADTAEALLEAVEYATEQVTAADAAGWFQHCGFLPQHY
ncbi:hypothetical protein AWN76_002605 [Rhodothermaceae bacterium RA]|nr:hypothetical protein AWN76_002605 [Rhodothermaceae bacterium RA]